MALADQFTEMDIKDLIGGPPPALPGPSVHPSQGMENFINIVGFDENKKPMTVDLCYEEKIHNEDGSDSTQKLNIKTPLIAMVPIPNLQIDAVSINFDMKVKEASSDESAD
jgi:hypothetical protein